MELADELEAIARAAADRLRAQTDGDAQREVELQRTVGEAATHAIALGLSLAEIADAERIGQLRAREELGADVLRRVERAARRKREVDSEYRQAVVRAGRLGLAYRDVAAAAGVAHGTVRAILARTQTPSARHPTATTTAVMAGAEPGRPSAGASRLVAAAADPGPRRRGEPVTGKCGRASEAVARGAAYAAPIYEPRRESPYCARGAVE